MGERGGRGNRNFKRDLVLVFKLEMKMAYFIIQIKFYKFNGVYFVTRRIMVYLWMLLYGQINCGRGRVEGGGRWEVGFDIIGGVPMN
jgi:hypothetical protein